MQIKGQKIRHNTEDANPKLQTQGGRLLKSERKKNSNFERTKCAESPPEIGHLKVRILLTRDCTGLWGLWFSNHRKTRSKDTGFWFSNTFWKLKPTVHRLIPTKIFRDKERTNRRTTAYKSIRKKANQCPWRVKPSEILPDLVEVDFLSINAKTFAFKLVTAASYTALRNCPRATT